MQRKLLAVALTVLYITTLAAGRAVAEDVKVTLIEVQGNRRIETATILAKIKTREGAVFSPAQIKEDIKTLYQLGHFEDVQVKTEGFEQGLKVIFWVKEKPLIREIGYEGNDEFTPEKLKEVVTLLPRSAYNLQLIQENAEKIRLKYQDSGYYHAVVVPVITDLRGGDKNVVYYIEEGEKIRLSEVIITGNKALSSDEIKKAMKNQEHWLFSFLGHSGTLRTDELKDDVDAVRNLYYNHGYIQVQVDQPVIEERPRTVHQYEFLGEPGEYVTENEVAIHLNIKEGDQFRVGSIAIKGNALIKEDDLRGEMKLKKGEIFNRDMLRQDVARIMDSYDSIARPFANVVPLFNIDQEQKTVAISIDIQEGGEVRIGRIDITGNTKTRDKVIRREMRLDEGDLYSKKAIKRSYERLNNLNFFETVDIVPERKQNEAVMDLDVKVKEKLTGNLSIGGGYSSVDKLMAIAEITQGNLGGRGQLLKFKTQWGHTRRLFMVSFMEPYLFDVPVWGRIDLYNQTQVFDGYDLKSNGIGLGIGKSFTEYVSGSIRYSVDQSSIYRITKTPTFLLQRQLDSYGNSVTTSAVTVSLTRDSRDFYLDPKMGSRNTAFVEYAGGPLGGDPEFIKSVADSAWYYPLFLDTVIMARGRVGFANSLSDLPLPTGERFFVGGSTTVRGYRYGTLGPMEPTFGPVYKTDQNGVTLIDPATGQPTIVNHEITGYNRVGGNKELVFNLEYTFPIVPAARLKGVLFYDMGRSFDESESIRFNKLRHSFGWGFWWLSPIGPLRFEWGYIIHEKPDDQKSLFEFSIGTLF
ncbi:MAG: outer membrane protein assembly factor BamA [Nitrospiraceae bacterium]|nr:outer membrane protein assembly factor BamA [Nitrospiraceae bacterium]